MDLLRSVVRSLAQVPDQRQYPPRVFDAALTEPA
ncbi:hypothetical protein SBA5_80051 [Candidatus Sulfotelmatomonas gaucii]|uniref:Uncharacterized protein n=1 Tax=Candidatus Sulfuritelmatomonas gaucii TaxID=2043161 RepID=A0A2N9M5E2_9BACT|nr:hypothetical protein SBA5_80051 [Candidatus Sulfotelmatomonas gaucii]